MASGALIYCTMFVRKMPIDLDARIRSLVQTGASRREIVRELDSIAIIAEKRAKRFERGKSADRHRAENERQLLARVGRLLFFLHHGVPADRATATDQLKYRRLIRRRACLWAVWR